ncbi:hypothetical protein WJX75_009980 [Coccomyxa subellipsoidea]|uniref:Protein kinase domain-containing protein n=1 Tax=Coccomyxa subellipsoidea TaxID=248742 RepID=A0ABR2YT06_9CHLO
MLSPVMDHLFLAYERVVMPCHNMNCGDVVHRSTLDPVLRLEQRGVTPQGVALVSAVIAYLFAKPGVLAGAIDYYILDKFQRLTNTKTYTKENLRLGKKLATGGFGTVYRADLVDDEEPGPQRPVVVKKAKEFGEAEVWMNERLMRAAPSCFARFITAFDDGNRQNTGKPEPLWLVWQYEGDFTLYDLMQKKDWPYNLEPVLFGRELNLPKSPRRRWITLRVIMQQIMEALKACHATGIVHRDVKPQNVILSDPDRRAKLIDLGAAADLRVGINYVPNEFLLDPRYAPPEQYIMSTQTPRAPPIPLAATLSPILWQLNNPDRFDMYSAGVMLLQATMPALRSDSALIAFRRKLEQCNYDMQAWRAQQERRNSREYAEGFAMLDLDDGAPWDLVCSLMQAAPRKRLSASAAAAHPALGGGITAALNSLSRRAGDAADKVLGTDTWLEGGLSGSQRSGGLTEAQISDELGPDLERFPIPRNASATISWWQLRQAAFNRAVQGKQARVQREAAGNLRKLTKMAAQTIRESKRKLPKVLLWGRTN